MSNWTLFNRKRKRKEDLWNIRTMFGPNLNFAATEAYKLLRTNLVFSFSDEGVGHVIGVTSAIQAEGKTSTACNTAYTLCEAGYRVLLIGADLRKPTINTKLGVARTPGLTNLLVARGNYKEAIQHSAAAPKLDVLTSGDVPPNPSELLASNRMVALMEEMKKDYDYIIVDLPPVGVVSDPLAMSKCLDGVIMVVRAGVSEKKILAEAMRQLEMVNLRILGFLFQDAETGTNQYGKRYSKKYYKYYNAYDKKNKTAAK